MGELAQDRHFVAESGDTVKNATFSEEELRRLSARLRDSASSEADSRIKSALAYAAVSLAQAAEFVRRRTQSE